jgi:hypothetical protein
MLAAMVVENRPSRNFAPFVRQKFWSVSDMAILQQLSSLQLT